MVQELDGEKVGNRACATFAQAPGSPALNEGRLSGGLWIQAMLSESQGASEAVVTLVWI